MDRRRWRLIGTSRIGDRFQLYLEKVNDGVIDESPRAKRYLIKQNNTYTVVWMIVLTTTLDEEVSVGFVAVFVSEVVTEVPPPVSVFVGVVVVC